MNKKKIEEWAEKQKRITNGAIRKAFAVDADTADLYYSYLKSAGIIGLRGFTVYYQEAPAYAEAFKAAAEAFKAAGKKHRKNIGEKAAGIRKSKKFTICDTKSPPVEFHIGALIKHYRNGKIYKVVERKNRECPMILARGSSVVPECDLCGDICVCLSTKCRAEKRSDGKNICYKETSMKENENR